MAPSLQIINFNRQICWVYRGYVQHIKKRTSKLQDQLIYRNQKQYNNNVVFHKSDHAMFVLGSYCGNPFCYAASWCLWYKPWKAESLRPTFDSEYFPDVNIFTVIILGGAIAWKHGNVWRGWIFETVVHNRTIQKNWRSSLLRRPSSTPLSYVFWRLLILSAWPSLLIWPLPLLQQRNFVRISIIWPSLWLMHCNSPVFLIMMHKLWKSKQENKWVTKIRQRSILNIRI